MFLRPPPPPPSRIVNTFSGETTESIIRRKLWEDDMEKWKKEQQKFRAMNSRNPNSW